MSVESLVQAIRTIPDFPEPGIQFKDITPILARPELIRESVNALIAPFKEKQIDKVVGMESRGFILGAMIAHELDAGFVPVRKKGKLPFETIAETYSLEYGTDTLEMHVDAIEEGDRVLVHDDVIATGGTAAATCRLIERSGGEVAGCAFLIDLTFLNGRKQLDGLCDHIHAVMLY